MTSALDAEPIRPATEEDADRIAGIFGFYVTHTTVSFETEPPTAAAWAQRIHDRDEAGRPFLVLERDGRVVGYAYLSPWSPKPAYRHTMETSVYLDPASTGAGRGRRLMEALIERASAAGVRELVAIIAESEDGASLALHRRLGFREVGTLERVGCKFDRWIDTVILQRSLLDAR